MTNQRIAIIGSGYVGLVTAACLADRGHSVTCVDVSADLVGRINAGQSPIHEPGLDALIRRHVGRRLRATTDLAGAVGEADAVLIAVGTPFDGRQIDLSFVRTAATQIGRALADSGHHTLVVTKSTVVPGTTDSVVRPLLEESSGLTAGEDFSLAVNPEFLSEGAAVDDFMNPDRIVIGGGDERAWELLERIYDGLAPAAPRVRCSTQTAEMIKYASNALQATAISFANEIANICGRLEGVDAANVLRGVHLMKELSGRDLESGLAPITRFLWPGCGFGGSCFPKDLAALVAFAGERGAATPLLQAVTDVNAERPQALVDLLQRAMGQLHGVRVAVLGLAFKPNTDDMRLSPAIPVIEQLMALEANVTACDPAAVENARVLLGDRVRYTPDLADAVADAEAVLIVTAWPEFRELPALLAHRAQPPIVVDGRRIIDPGSVATYVGVGRGAQVPRETAAATHRTGMGGTR